MRRALSALTVIRRPGIAHLIRKLARRVLIVVAVQRAVRQPVEGLAELLLVQFVPGLEHGPFEDILHFSVSERGPEDKWILEHVDGGDVSLPDEVDRAKADLRVLEEPLELGADDVTL